MRKDGRKNNELRPVHFTKDFTKNALGSVLVEFGDTKVITTASVAMKQPKWMDKDSTQGWVTAEYSLLPSSTSTRCERERTKISHRSDNLKSGTDVVKCCGDCGKVGSHIKVIQ